MKTAIAFPLVLSAMSPMAAADVTYVNFSSTSGLALVGSAERNGTALRLTRSLPDRSGAAWATSRQNVVAPFTCEFEFDAFGVADGMAFVIQRDAVNALGPSGQDLGYGGIANSIAVEIDTFDNPVNSDPSANHISVHTRGAAANSSNHDSSLGSTSLVLDLNDGVAHTMRIEYVPGMLRVMVDDSTPALQVAVDIGATLNLGDGTAWVGFTAGTGGATQSHEVLSWSFIENASVPTGNRPPLVPTIDQPLAGGAAVDPNGPGLGVSGFGDPDGGAHSCTDFEIWTIQPAERVWAASCLSGANLLTAGLSQGVFIGSHAGQSSLDSSAAYAFRARFADGSGDPLTEFGPWAERPFQTGQAGAFTALELGDVVPSPGPELLYAASGAPLDLPSAGTAARVVLETASGQELLSIVGAGSAGNTTANPGALAGPAPVRLRVEAGGTAWAQNELDLVFRDGSCIRRRVLIPALALAPGAAAQFWVTENGATWAATPGQTVPSFTTLARSEQLAWDVADPGYEVQVVASGLQLPVNLAFVPNPGRAPGDPFLYVTELYGAIKVVTNDGTVSTYADNLLNYNPFGPFPGSGEQGLGGILVDPLTGDVLLSLLYDQGGPHFPRVVKLTSLDGGLTASSQTTLLDMPGEPQGQAHYISHLELMADRTVLVHMGDGFDASTARNLNSYRGKILRMNLDGSPPTDNPFYTPGTVTARDYVYVLGVRNPFGGRTRAADGAHYFVSNGPDVDRLSKVVPGRDYLWAGSNAQMFNFAIHAWAPAVGPVNMAWVQGPAFGGSGFPQSKQDRAFVSQAGQTYGQGPDSRGKRITEFELDAQGQLVSGPTTFVEYVGPGRSTAVGLAAGPGGLYFTDFYEEQGSNPVAPGANILRVKYVGEDPEVCSALGQPYCVPAELNSSGESAVLRAAGSAIAADADLTLQAIGLPTNVFALCLASQTQDFVASPGGSRGNLCLGGTIGRFNGQIVGSGASGQFSIAINTANLPAPLGVVNAGETWNFQAWFRDFQLVATSNFTSGISITFQ